MEALEILKLRYNTALESKNFSDFTYNVYEYIYLINHTPEFKQVIDQMRDDYYNAVRKNGKSSRKIETFSPYASHYIELEIPIYNIIYEYKHSPEPDIQQDPAALLLLYGKNDPTLYHWYKHRYHLRWRWQIKKRIDDLARWLGTHEQLKNHLRQFHIALMTAISKTETTTKNTPQYQLPTSTFSFSPTTGKFLFNRTRDTLSPKSNLFKVLLTLYISPDYQATYKQLINSYTYYRSETLKSQKDELSQIIKQLKHKLGVLPNSETSNTDIFKNIKGYGYKLDL